MSNLTINHKHEKFFYIELNGYKQLFLFPNASQGANLARLSPNEITQCNDLEQRFINVFVKKFLNSKDSSVDFDKKILTCVNYQITDETDLINELGIAQKLIYDSTDKSMNVVIGSNLNDFNHSHWLLVCQLSMDVSKTF